MSYSGSPNRLVDISMEIAVGIIRLCDEIKGHYSIVNQLERSGTSIGANIREGNYAHGRADFIAKFQIALKECYETEYWLELFIRAEIVTEQQADPVYQLCKTTRRMLISSITTAKQKLADNKQQHI